MDHMRQLMSQYAFALRGIGGVLTFTEHDVTPHGISTRVHRSGGIRRLVIRMNPNIAEIVPKPRLHGSPETPVQRLTRRSKHLIHHRRNHRLIMRIAKLSLTAGATHPPVVVTRVTGTLALQGPPVGA